MLKVHELTITELARRAGLARATVSEWINNGVGAITIQSVFLVADALGEDRGEALRAAANLPPERDIEVDLILSSDRSDATKAAMIERLMRRRREEAARRLEDLRWLLEGDHDGSGEAQAG